MKRKYGILWGYCSCGVKSICNVVDNGIGITDYGGNESRDIRLEVRSECCDSPMFFDSACTREITIDDVPDSSGDL